MPSPPDKKRLRSLVPLHDAQPHHGLGQIIRQAGFFLQFPSIKQEVLLFLNQFFQYTTFLLLIESALPSNVAISFFIAGSSANALYGAIHGIYFFQPNDIDVYAMGTLDAFGHLISSACTFFSSHNIKFERIEYRYDHFKYLVVDYKLHGYPFVLSFIHVPGFHTLQEILHSFDIDICQIGWDIHTNKFILSEAVVRALKSRRATVVRSFQFDSVVPSEEQIRALHNTLQRMRKYHQRGFRFQNTPHVAFPPIHVTNNQAAVVTQLEDDNSDS